MRRIGRGSCCWLVRRLLLLRERGIRKDGSGAVLWVPGHASGLVTTSRPVLHVLQRHAGCSIACRAWRYGVPWSTSDGTPNLCQPTTNAVLHGLTALFRHGAHHVPKQSRVRAYDRLASALVSGQENHWKQNDSYRVSSSRVGGLHFCNSYHPHRRARLPIPPAAVYPETHLASPAELSPPQIHTLRSKP